MISTVRVEPSGRRRWAPIVPNFSPCVHTASPQPRSSALTSRRPGVGRQVEVELDPVGADQQVAHRAADEVQAVAGRGEPLGQRGQLVEDRGEAFGDHDAAEGYVATRSHRQRWRSRRRAATTRCGRRPRPRRPDHPSSGASGDDRRAGERAEHGRRARRQGVEVVAALEHRHAPPGRDERQGPRREQARSRRRSGRARSAGRRGGRRTRPRSAATSARSARPPGRRPRRRPAGRRRPSRPAAAGCSSSCPVRRRCRSR